MAATKQEEAIDPTVRLYLLERFSSSSMCSHSSSLNLSSEFEPFSCADVIASDALVLTWSLYDLAWSGNRQASFLDALTISTTAYQWHQQKVRPRKLVNRRMNLIPSRRVE